MRMNFFAIHWNDDGIQNIVDMTDDVEQDMLNRLKSIKPDNPNHVFPWMLMRARNTPEKHPQVYGFQSHHDLAFLEYVWKNDPKTLLENVLKSGVTMLD